jgi:hypothetical protein
MQSSPSSGLPPQGPQDVGTFQAAFEVRTNTGEGGKQVKQDCAVCHRLSVLINGREYGDGEAVTLPKGETHTVKVKDRPEPRDTPPGGDSSPPHTSNQKFTVWPQAVDGQTITSIQGNGPADSPQVFIAKKAEILQYLLDNSEALMAQDKDWPENPADEPMNKKARLGSVEVTDFKAEDYGAGIETSGTYGDINLQPGSVVVWGRSLVSAIIKAPDGFSNTIIEPRIVQDVTPNRTRIFTTPTSQGHTKEIMQYQNRKVLDNVLDESWVDMITIRRLAQDVLIESRDQPAQGGGPEHSGISIADKFDAYLQCNVFGQGWSTYGKVEWRFNANLSRSGSTWTGSAAITGGTGLLTAEQPVMQPNIHPVQFVPQ